jgi:hypothetical protein
VFIIFDADTAPGDAAYAWHAPAGKPVSFPKCGRNQPPLATLRLLAA